MRRAFLPWIHASVIGLAAGAAYLEGVAQRFGGAWIALGLIVVSRTLGAFLASAPKLPKRRATQRELLENLALLTRQLIAATHGLSNQTTIIVGEIELVLEQLGGDA